MNGRTPIARANLPGLIASGSAVVVAFLAVFALGVLVPDATDPAAYGSVASLVWGASASIMLVAWAVFLWCVARLWSSRPGERAWAVRICGMFAYSLPALALALYLFGTGIAIAQRPPFLDTASAVLGLTGFAALIGGCVLGLMRISALASRA